MRFRFAPLLLVLASFQAYSQSLEYKFDRLQNIKGLAQRSVNSIAQDKAGFIWIGSPDGLLRFDGYELKIYKNNLRNGNSLADNNIRAIAVDKEGNLWIATQGGGLDKFDTRLEKFIHHKNNPKDETSISGNAVWSVFVDKEDNVWAGTWSDGLNKLDAKTQKFERIGSVRDPIMAIAQSDDGKIWFGGRGLNSVDPASSAVKNYTLQAESSIKKNSSVRALIISQSGKVWAGTDEDGIFILDPTAETFQHITHSKPEAAQVYALFEGTDGKIMAGTNAGFAIASEESISEIFSYDAANPLTISNNSVRSITQDGQGGIWVGCEGAGLNKLLDRKKFQLFRSEAGNEGSISFNLIRSIYDDNMGRIWVGTQGGGLNLFDAEEKKFKLVGNGSKGTFQLSSNQISSIYQDKLGTFWVGTWGFGLNKVNLSTNQVKVYRHEGKNSPPDDRIQITYEDKQGNFWVGTENGLARFDRETETWKQYPHDENNPTSIIGNNIQGQAFVETEDESLWIGTWFGLNRFNKERSTFEHYTSDTANTNSLSSDHVISLHADKSGNIWVGTFGGGLNQLEIKTGIIHHYSEEEGLANNTIFGIKEDNEGNLWMSTSNGLSRFNKNTKSFTNYDVSEGLQSNEFYWGAAHKAKDGSMLFGGINGLNWFHPSEIQNNKNVPPVVITDFQIFNKSVPVLRGSILEQSIQYTESIRLSYDQAVISFQFAALNYSYPEKNQYAYQLENFDKEWNYVGNKRTATYTNLDPGEYIFRLKGSNNDNVWNEKGVQLKIVITPPFWKTWWFYTLAFSTTIGFFYAFVKIRVRQEKKDKERMRLSLEQSLQDAKFELEQQKKEMRDEQDRNKERIWTDQSHAKFASILSTSKNNVKELSAMILSALVQHLRVAGGAIYLFDSTHEILKTMASYGFEKAKDVALGEGLVSECFEHKETRIINEVPGSFFKISSGLGSTTPTAIILVPLKYEEICVGVIELAAFSAMPDFQIQFVQSLAERLTTALNTTLMSQRTEELLQESKHQAEELKVREEELKQNLEELLATNEDRDRRTRELEEQIQELKKRLQ